MAALSAWNGGVIVISHDERFITKVASEVRPLFVNLRQACTDSYDLLTRRSYGYAQMERCRSTTEMLPRTRS